MPMLGFCLDQVLPWPLSAALESPLTHQHPSIHLPALHLAQLDKNTTMPATLSLNHAITTSSPIQAHQPCL